MQKSVAIWLATGMDLAGKAMTHPPFVCGRLSALPVTNRTQTFSLPTVNARLHKVTPERSEQKFGPELGSKPAVSEVALAVLAA